MSRSSCTGDDFLDASRVAGTSSVGSSRRSLVRRTSEVERLRGSRCSACRSTGRPSRGSAFAPRTCSTRLRHSRSPRGRGAVGNGDSRCRSGSPSCSGRSRGRRTGDRGNTRRCAGAPRPGRGHPRRAGTSPDRTEMSERLTLEMNVRGREWRASSPRQRQRIEAEFDVPLGVPVPTGAARTETSDEPGSLAFLVPLVLILTVPAGRTSARRGSRCSCTATCRWR